MNKRMYKKIAKREDKAKLISKIIKFTNGENYFERKNLYMRGEVNGSNDCVNYIISNCFDKC